MALAWGNIESLQAAVIRHQPRDNAPSSHPQRRRHPLVPSAILNRPPVFDAYRSQL